MKSHTGLACAIVMLIATIVQAQVVNGSFEADASGAVPSGWLWTGGLALVSDVPDALFPSAGSKYLVLDAFESGPATPGYGPTLWGGTGSVRQVVLRPPGEFCSLSVDWEFLPVETVPNLNNDFFSIDVVHDVTGSLITNVVFVDTGLTASSIPYTNVPGAGAGVLTWVPTQSTVYPVAWDRWTGGLVTAGVQAPAGFKRATVDLSAVPVGTPMRIEISVANGGDLYLDSKAYVDRVVLSAGQRNDHTGDASLRVLGSPHVDGLGSDLDWSGDHLLTAPYHLRTCQGQLLSFRASGETGLSWVLVAGVLVNPGFPTPFGQVNVDLFSGSPFLVLINGFANDPLGTLADPATWVNVQVPESTPLGLQITLQAAMEQPGGALSLTAATTIEVGTPQVPIGGADVGGSAATNDGSTNQPLVAFGGGTWPFYGTPRSSVYVNSNGSVSFGAGESTPTESESGMLTGPARIGLVWDDLFPPGGGLVRSTQTASTYTVSWTNMQESSTGLHGNNVSVQLYQGIGPTPPGVFTIYFGSTTMADGLTGISPGNLPPPAPNVVSSNVDWTSLGGSLGARGVIPAGTPLFERFALGDDGQPRDTFDLMSLGGVSRITFVPDGAGGYTYFVGTR